MTIETSFPNYFSQMLADTVDLISAFKSGVDGDLTNPNFKSESYFVLSGLSFPYMQLTPRANVDAGKWKFHFSVSAEDTIEAWNIIVHNLTNDGDKHLAKVALPMIWNDLADPDFRQVGKIITLYDTGAYSPKHLMELIAKINQELEDQELSPSLLPITNRVISGSAFVSYKRDRDPDGVRRLQDHHVMDLPRNIRHNPRNEPDPYSKFCL